MKKLVNISADPYHSVIISNRLLQAYAGLISAGLVFWFLVVLGVSGWSYLCFLALLSCTGTGAISTSAGPAILAPVHQSNLVSIKLGIVSRERGSCDDAFKYYDPESQEI